MSVRRPSGAELRLVTDSPTTLEELEDAALVERALTGERRAEEALLRRHLGDLTRVVARMLGNREDTDDVVQDTLLIALQKLNQLQDRASFRSWLLMIGVNEVRRVFRRRKIRRFVGLETRDDGLGLDAFASTDSSPEIRAELSLLSEVLRRLPANQRIAWSLRYVEGYALEEVAKACGFSLATAKRKITAAQACVRAVVDVEEGDLG